MEYFLSAFFFTTSTVPGISLALRLFLSVLTVYIFVLFKKNLNASKPSEHPPSVGKCLKVYVGTLAVETKTLHGIKRVPQCNHIGSTV